MAKKIFILGVGRSGTSLLQSIMHSHSRVSFLKENQILKNIMRGNLNEDLKEHDLLKALLETTKIQRVLREPSIINLSSPLNAYESIIKDYISTTSKSLVYIGDKDPGNIDYFEKIYEIFGESKFLLMVRDPRAVIASRMKAKWSKKYPFVLQILLYYAQQKLCYKKLSKNSDIPILIIRYHDLVNNFRLEVEKILNWLDLEFEEECLSFQKSALELITEDEMSWKKNLIKPITDNDEKWKTQLKPSQIKLIEHINWFFIEEFDLQFTFKRPSTLKRLLYSLSSNLFAYLYRYYRRVY